MAKRANIIPKATAGRILMNAGAKRVSADAVDVFTEILEDITRGIAEKSLLVARHSGRKTIKEEDIKLAASS